MQPVGDAAYVALGAGTLAALAALVRLAVVQIHRRAARTLWHDAARISDFTCAGATRDLAATLVGELGTPITSLLNNLGSAQRLLARGHLSELTEVRAAVDEACTTGEQVVRLIQDLRAFQGADRWEPINLNDAADRAIRLVGRHAAAEGVSLAVELDRSLPTLWGDQAQVVQVALGLVVHAVDAASGASRAKVSVRTLLSSEGAELLVANSGPSVSESERTSLFERPPPSSPGSFGLAAIRCLVEAQGGRIVAERPESGALIRVVWPVQRTEPAVPPTNRPDPSPAPI